MNDDRREYRRFKIDQLIQASFDRESYIYTSGINISESGLLCKTEQEMELYSSIFLMIEVTPELPPVICEGLVVRCDSDEDGTYDVGIHFSSIKNKESLKQLIS